MRAYWWGGWKIPNSLTSTIVQQRFAEYFNGEPRLFRAPARTNIIGEHTDYNDGLVLPTTTALYTWVAAKPRDDRTVNVSSLVANETVSLDLDDLLAGPATSWSRYIAGVLLEIEREGLRLNGADLFIDTDIPIGGGMSSSASLELAAGRALLDVSSQSLDRRRLAELCQTAEVETVGVKCGIMDQYAIACCQRGRAMLIDCRTLDVRQVVLPKHAAFLIVDTGVRHQLPDGDYNDRRFECERALSILNAGQARFDSLRDVSLSQLAAAADSLGEVLYRRCNHVISENQRVADAVATLNAGDLEGLGRQMSA